VVVGAAGRLVRPGPAGEAGRPGSSKRPGCRRLGHAPGGIRRYSLGLT
jgi:hypothetical protein